MEVVYWIIGTYVLMGVLIFVQILLDRQAQNRPIHFNHTFPLLLALIIMVVAWPWRQRRLKKLQQQGRYFRVLRA